MAFNNVRKLHVLGNAFVRSHTFHTVTAESRASGIRDTRLFKVPGRDSASDPEMLI